MRPGCVHFPIACRKDCLVVHIRVLAAQRFENLSLNPRTKRMQKTTVSLHPSSSLENATADCIPAPVLGGAHRRLQDPPPYFFGYAGVQVELAQRLLDPVERVSRNWEVIDLLEPLRVCMLEDRSQGDRRSAADVLGLVAARPVARTRRSSSSGNSTSLVATARPAFMDCRGVDGKLDAARLKASASLLAFGHYYGFLGRDRQFDRADLEQPKTRPCARQAAQVPCARPSALPCTERIARPGSHVDQCGLERRRNQFFWDSFKRLHDAGDLMHIFV